MQKFFTSSIGRLRLLAFLEGVSYLALVFVAVPIKWLMGEPWLVQAIGPVHGGLFVLFLLSAVQVSIEQSWKFGQTTWKVLLSSLIPFGTFYIDKKILSPIHALNAGE